MSNTDKHKPLSAEELFKLLDNTSNKLSDFDEMDDFEKEALEGFSAHSDAQKAKALTDELNLAVSKKAAESNNGGTKNKIIWFSAAASIVLILMVSIFFFFQTKEDSATNIALNELKEDQVPESAIAGSVTLESTNAISDTKDAVQANEPVQKISLNDKEVDFNKNAEGERLAGGVSAAGTTAPSPEYRTENNPDILLSEKAAKDEAKNRNDLDMDDLKKQGDIVSDNLETKKKEKATISQEQAREESLTSQTLNTVVLSNSTANNSNNGTKEEDGYYKADADKSAVAKKSLEKEKTSSVASRSPSANKSKADDSINNPNNEPVGGNLASAPMSTMGSKTVNAYYLGSELAIRDYVLNYLKEKKSTISLVGNYKIKGIVSVDGKLKVSSIMQLTKVNCNCEDIITEALNTMIKWSPALKEGKKISSIVEFTVAF